MKDKSFIQRIKVENDNNKKPEKKQPYDPTNYPFGAEEILLVQELGDSENEK